MPDLYQVRAYYVGHPVPETQIESIEAVARQRHATTYRREKAGTLYGVVLFLCETRERAERLKADLLAHPALAIVSMDARPTAYDCTPYLHPVGSRVRAKEDLLDPETQSHVVVRAGGVGTVLRHGDEHSYVCRFDCDTDRQVFALDFELCEVGPPCLFCNAPAHYDLGFADLFAVSCCCDHLADTKTTLGPEAVCEDRDL